MIFLWIITGAFATILGFVLVRLLLNAGIWIMNFGLMVVGVVAVERKFTAKLIGRLYERYDEQALVGLGVFGWVIVAVIVVALVAAVSILTYQLYSLFA